MVNLIELIEKTFSELEVKACPCCKSSQVQVCIDANNINKTVVKCRICKIQGPYQSWNNRE